MSHVAEHRGAIPAVDCVAAVLGDPLRRATALGGRDGMPRSLGSVYSGAITLFLGGLCRGVVARVLHTPNVKSYSGGVAVTRDGTTLLVSDYSGRTNSVLELSVADGSLLRVIGGRGKGPQQFNVVCQVCVAPDGFVFVADRYNNRVQVLTPTLDFHAFVGVGQLIRPSGVCATSDIVVVAEGVAHCIAVFVRSDATLLSRFGTAGDGDGQLNWPLGVCFVSSDRHVAVADSNNNRVCLFAVTGRGEFVRHVGVGVLAEPSAVASAAFDELVVADTGNNRVALFNAAGELLQCLGTGCFSGVAVHRGTIFAQDYDGSVCVVFE